MRRHGHLQTRRTPAERRRSAGAVPLHAPTELRDRITRRDYTVGVIGLGYVGLPLVLRFGESGFRVLGFDIDAAKVDYLNCGKSYIRHISGERLQALIEAKRFAALDDFARLREPDAIIICVPTPLNNNREPDLQYVASTADAVARALRRGQLVCLMSTTYPGTTEEIVLTRLAAGGLRVGDDFFLAYAPEREDPGNGAFDTKTVPKVVGGMTPACLDLAATLFSEVIDRVARVSSPRVAESCKVLENIYRSVNIALVNELKIVFDRMGIDVWEVIEAAQTKPFGFQAFYPGPGLGGHCIPIDPFYLTWKAREFGLSTRFIELAGEINSAMPAYVVDRLGDALNARRRPVNGSKVLVLGVSYKKDVDDLRESPALEILELLQAKGADVAYSDPYCPRLPAMRRHNLRLESTALTPETLQRQDAVVLVTDHSSFPYSTIHTAAPLIVDTRNAFGRRGLNGPNMVQA
jgi:UDP-N-acetyl-D-glucosamine dehydrogenase